RGKPPAPSTLIKRQEKVAFWTGYLESTAIHAITRSDIGKFESWIYDLPANSSKLYESPAKAVEAAIQGHKHKVVSAGKTAVDYLQTLGHIFKLAKQRGYISDNPAEHLLEVSYHRQGATGKPPFSKSDLLKIFPADYGAD